MPTLDSFERLKAYQQQQQEQEDEARSQALDSRFNASLHGRYAEMPPGNFASLLPDVDSISIVPVGDDAKTLSVSLFAERDEKERHYTFSLLSDGTLSGEIPPDLQHLTRDQIKEEVIDIAERVQLPFFERVPGDIFPSAEGIGPERGEQAAHPSKPARIDRRRLSFLQNQSDALFAFTEAGKGFDGYYGFVFPWGIVMEHPVAENRVFFIKFDEPLDIPEERMKLPPAQRVPRTMREELHDEYWEPLRHKSKWEAESLGIVEGKRHKPIDAWMEQLDEELSRRRSAV